MQTTVGVKRYLYNPDLVKYRKDNHLTQVQFANSIGMNIAYYQQIETYKVYPTEDAKKLLSDIIDIPYDILFPEWTRPIYKKDRLIHREYKLKSEQLVYMQRLLLPKLDGDMDADINKLCDSNVINKSLETLSDREKTVVNFHYGLNGINPRTLEDTGKILGTTGSRARQIEARAIRKLRHPIRSKVLREIA